MSYEMDNGAKDSLQLAANRLMRLRYRVKSEGEAKRILAEAVDLILDVAKIQDAAKRRRNIRDYLRQGGR